MIELGQLEGKHQEFAKRKTRVVVASIEDQETAAKTQADFPHLVVIADAGRKLTEALAVLHPGSHHDGGDTSAPTTLLIDGAGTVRWIYRPSRFLVRLAPAEVLAAVDEKLGRE
ncbi:MAG: peroxiredoxin family protein [Gemmataceae bacterium]|nr:peroxiredoxin family protein [Gemmataceae bacterium]